MSIRIIWILFHKLFMSLKEVQNEVDKWVQQHKIGYWKPHKILARLTEETGEIAREINHIYGSKKKNFRTSD